MESDASLSIWDLEAFLLPKAEPDGHFVFMSSFEEYSGSIQWFRFVLSSSYNI
jgi:hypothetical protein